MPITKKIIVVKSKTKKINKSSNKSNIHNHSHRHTKDDLQHTYNKYYPSILNPNFGSLITNHKIFKNYKLKHNEDKLQQLYKDFEDNAMSKVKTDKSNIYILKKENSDTIV